MILVTEAKGFSKTDVNVIKSTWPQIEWLVIPIKAPHRVGVAEAMVKDVKRIKIYLYKNPVSHRV